MRGRRSPACREQRHTTAVASATMTPFRLRRSSRPTSDWARTTRAWCPAGARLRLDLLAPGAAPARLAAASPLPPGQQPPVLGEDRGVVALEGRAGARQPRRLWPACTRSQGGRGRCGRWAALSRHSRRSDGSRSTIRRRLQARIASSVSRTLLARRSAGASLTISRFTAPAPHPRADTPTVARTTMTSENPGRFRGQPHAVLPIPTRPVGGRDRHGGGSPPRPRGFLFVFLINWRYICRVSGNSSGRTRRWVVSHLAPPSPSRRQRDDSTGVNRPSAA